MRVLFASTGSGDTDKYPRSLRCLGHEVDTIRYDIPGANDQRLTRQIAQHGADLIVYIGSRWGATISPAALAYINANIAPTVHICSDAADPPWHDLLRQYHDAGSFTVQVAIDGNPQWPLAATDITCLTPIDPTHYSAEPIAHAQRTYVCGYAGNGGGPETVRRFFLSELSFRHMVQVRLPVEGDSYPGYCAFLEQCRMTPNFPHSGSQTAMQVKGRVVEAALAGACLLEMRGAPSSCWFTPGEDYIEYQKAYELINIVAELWAKPEHTQAIALRLREKVLAQHSPAVFWGRIMERVDLVHGKRDVALTG